MGTNVGADQFAAEIARVIRSARAPRASQTKTRVFRQAQPREAQRCPTCNNLPWVESGLNAYYVYCDYVHCNQTVYGKARGVSGAFIDWNEQLFRAGLVR